MAQPSSPAVIAGITSSGVHAFLRQQWINTVWECSPTAQGLQTHAIQFHIYSRVAATKSSLIWLLSARHMSSHSSMSSKICPLLSPQCVFLIWCMAPVTWNGSEILYKRIIRPFFLKHQSAMDDMVSDITSKAKNITEQVTKEGEIPTIYMQVQPLILFKKLQSDSSCMQLDRDGSQSCSFWGFWQLNKIIYKTRKSLICTFCYFKTALANYVGQRTWSELSMQQRDLVSLHKLRRVNGKKKRETQLTKNILIWLLFWEDKRDGRSATQPIINI